MVLRLSVDGRPTIPESYSIRAGRDAFLWLKGMRSGPVEEDRARSELRFRMRTPPGATETSIWFHADGGWPRQATAMASSDDGPLVADVAVESAGFLVPDVVPAGEQDVGVAMFEPEAGRWVEAPAPPGYHGLGLVERDGVPAYGPLRPGRYRLYDEVSGSTSEVVDVVGGGPPAKVRLDLSKAGRAEGRVSIPESKTPPAEPQEARVFVEGEGILHFRPGLVGWLDGKFSVGVPGDRPVTIRPWHPILVPADPGGTAVVTAPRKGLVLALVPGTWCDLRTTPAPQPAPWLPPLRALRYAGEPLGEPEAEHPIALHDGTLYFGGYPKGTWTLWVDVHGFAPAVLRGVRLLEGRTELGDVPLERGSGVRVRVLWDGPPDPPPVIVAAERLDAPRYRRVVEAKPDPFVLLTGLGPGRFRVEVLDKGAVRREEREVEVDGTADVEMSFDLR